MLKGVAGGVQAGGSPSFVTMTSDTIILNRANPDVYLNRYAAKQLMISGDGVGATTNAGLILGYFGTTGKSAVWSSTVTPSTSNYAFFISSSASEFNAPAGGAVRINVNDVTKITQSDVAGIGPAITAGTATTDVAALSITRTNNNAAVATGVKFAFTDTSSAAGFLPFQVLGGASATTSLLSLGKAGETTILSLAGTGSRAVLADANGLLSAPVSDERMKEEWKPLPESYGLPMVMRLTPRIGKYKDRDRYGNQDYLGFYARETSEFLPEITGQDNKGTYYLTDEKVTAVLVKAVQQIAKHVGLQ